MYVYITDYLNQSLIRFHFISILFPALKKSNLHPHLHSCMTSASIRIWQKKQIRIWKRHYRFVFIS